MAGNIKRVDEFDRVSSKEGTKIFSAVFVLALAAAFLYSGSLFSISIASDITIENIIKLTNESRVKIGGNAFVLNTKLSRAAEDKADNMFEKNYFSHTSPDGITPWHWLEIENYDYNYAGENLAMDFQSTNKMQNAWMASPTHRANILSQKYTEVGVAIKEGVLNNRQTILAVVIFGSGDRNDVSAEPTEKIISSPKEEKFSQGSIPLLPKAEARTKIVFNQTPIVTNPQSGEYIPEDNMSIIGRAVPQSRIQIYEENNLIGSQAVDEDGWFQVKVKDLADGPHRLTLKNEKSFAETSFFVDRNKPKVDYRLFTDKNYPGQLFLKVSADKNNCSLELNGEKRMMMKEETAVFSIATDKTTAVIRISDRAGNKNFKQVYIGNYYPEINSSIFSEKLITRIFPTEDFFAARSGRETIRKNLGLGPNQLFASQYADIH